VSYILTRRRAVSILLALLEKPRSVKELIAVAGGSPETIEKRLRELTELGLVKIEKKKGEPYGKPYIKEVSLTDKGRHIAEMLKEAKSVLDILGVK